MVHPSLLHFGSGPGSYPAARGPLFTEEQNQDFTLTGSVPGEKGDPGADGLNGTDGIDGADGKDGQDGLNGTDGIDGTNADCTGYLPIGDKGASLRLPTTGENVKVLAVESPHLLITDLVEVPAIGEAPIDPRYLDCIDLDTLRITACHIAGPFDCFAHLTHDRTIIRVQRRQWPDLVCEPDIPAIVTLTGHRRGSQNLRFPAATGYEVIKSLEFRDRCLGVLPPHPSSLGQNTCTPGSGCC